MKKLRLLLFILLLALPYILLGEEEETAKRKEKIYSSSTSFSALIAGGNTKSLNLSLETNQTLQFEKDRFDLNAGIIYAHSNRERQSEIITSSFQYRRLFSQKTYFLAGAIFNRNVLSGYDYRLVFSTGAGYRWIHRSRVDLTSEISLGWSSEKSRGDSSLSEAGDFSPSPDRNNTSFLTAAISSLLDYKISNSADFAHSESFFFNMDNPSAYRIESRTSISASLNRNFALKTSLQIFFENRPVPGFEKTDILLLSSIVVNI